MSGTWNNKSDLKKVESFNFLKEIQRLVNYPHLQERYKNFAFMNNSYQIKLQLSYNGFLTFCEKGRQYVQANIFLREIDQRKKLRNNQRLQQNKQLPWGFFNHGKYRKKSYNFIKKRYNFITSQIQKC